MLDVPTARALLARTRPARNPDGYPPEVRKQVGELAVRLRVKGWSLSAISRELGITRNTVRAWLLEVGEPGPGFVPVVVAGEGVRTTAESGEGAGVEGARTTGHSTVGNVAGRRGARREEGRPALTLVSPSGYRLEGLDLEGAILALSRLG